MALITHSTRSPKTTPAPPALTPRHNLLALWHLCSLDAPTVAALWTFSIAHVSGVALPPTAIAAMALVVWILYAADRLLDARLLESQPLQSPSDLEARHLFHHRHRTSFLAGIALCSILLTPLLLRIPPAAIRLYLVEGSLLVGWFLLIHATRTSFRLPKELAVGLFFAAAVFIPTVARAPQLRIPLLPPAILFAALCSLNCLFIYRWEHEHSAQPNRAHLTTKLALRFLPQLAIILTAASITVALWQHATRRTPWPLTAACALSTILLLLLHASRHTLHRTTLRAAADLVLLTPALALLTPLFGLLHW